ncbi:hypothetical protein D3C81_1842080 [compost metagenome]
MRQRIRLTVDGYIPFFHYFKQRRLRLGCRTVDLVGEQNIRHHGTGTEMEHLIARMIDRYPRYITRENIGIALNPAVLPGH